MRVMINGRSYSGKDQIADCLVERYNFKKISFAAPVYEIAREYFKMTEKDRPLLISIGQKMREIKPSIWIDWVLDRLDDKYNWVISDIRQANEYKLCKEVGFIPVRVNSSLENRIKRCESRDGFKPSQETIALWESEGEIGADGFTYYEINNNGTLEELCKQIDEFMEIQYRDSSGICGVTNLGCCKCAEFCSSRKRIK